MSVDVHYTAILFANTGSPTGRFWKCFTIKEAQSQTTHCAEVSGRRETKGGVSFQGDRQLWPAEATSSSPPSVQTLLAASQHATQHLLYISNQLNQLTCNCFCSLHIRHVATVPECSASPWGFLFQFQCDLLVLSWSACDKTHQHIGHTMSPQWTVHIGYMASFTPWQVSVILCTHSRGPLQHHNKSKLKNYKFLKTHTHKNPHKTITTTTKKHQKTFVAQANSECRHKTLLRKTVQKSQKMPVAFLNCSHL